MKLTNTIRTCTLFACLPLTYSQAATLTGTGAHLPFGTFPHNSDFNYEQATLSSTPGGFTGTWGSSVQAAWQGTFSATGAIPTNSNTGSNTWDFTSLPTSALPAGSAIGLGDLDDGSSSTISFKAYDSSGNPLTEWLDEPFLTRGTGTGAGGSVISTNMPGWEWNAATSTYIFDGDTSGGNPAIGVYLLTNQAISTLETADTRSSNNYGIYAPVVPEPSSTALLGLGGLALILRRRR